MLKKLFTTTSDQNYFTKESYLTCTWNSLTKKASELERLVFSSLYTVYDFPRSTNPVTQQREFRWVFTFVEQSLGNIAYFTLLKKSSGVVKRNRYNLW